jgi:hypothetical protein
LGATFPLREEMAAEGGGAALMGASLLSPGDKEEAARWGELLRGDARAAHSKLREWLKVCVARPFPNCASKCVKMTQDYFGNNCKKRSQLNLEIKIANNEL